MKKILLVLFIFITGCSAEYNINIDNNFINENVSLSFPKGIISEDIYKHQTSASIGVYGGEDKYEMNKKEDDSNYYVNYSYEHKVSDYTRSNFLVKCFSYNNVIDNNDTIKLETSDRFNCIKLEDDAYLNEVKFNVITDLKVIKSNADVINGNKYTWIFDESNYENKSISIELKKDNSLTGAVTRVFKSRTFIYISLGIFIIIVIVFITFIFIKNKNIESNKL